MFAVESTYLIIQDVQLATRHKAPEPTSTKVDDLEAVSMRQFLEGLKG